MDFMESNSHVDSGRIAATDSTENGRSYSYAVESLYNLLYLIEHDADKLESVRRYVFMARSVLDGMLKPVVRPPKW